MQGPQAALAIVDRLDLDVHHYLHATRAERGTTTTTPTHARGAAAPAFTPAAELYPFQSRWLASSAGRVDYVDEGEGRAILMCHKNPTWSFLYRDVIRELTGRLRCVAVDLPGFGLSDRPPGYGSGDSARDEPAGDRGRLRAGPGRAGGRLASFFDPDGNGWVLKRRPPAR